MANMFGGKDAINPSYPTQWALNPNAYQNIDCSNVDWAALAQQWIAMKEAAAIVAAVPPTSKPDVEEGEAPMEVENPDAVNHDSSEMNPVGDQWDAAANQWGNNWNQWGWDPTVGNMGMPMMDGYAVPNDGSAPMAGYGAGAGPTFQHGYWTAPQAEQGPAPAGRASSRRSKSKNRDSKGSTSRSHRSNRSTSHREKPLPPPVMEPVSVASATLDAAKRRQLPAWIREGLEKMEREKQKAIEREEEKKARKLAEVEKKRLEQEELARIKADSTGEPVLPPKSKFESDSEAEESDKELPADEDPAEEGPAPAPPSPPRLQPTPPPPPPPPVRRSKEDILQEVMLAVRRSLTEILLEVTDQEIVMVSQEELARYTVAQATRLNAMKASNSKALASIASGLGLGAYESSSEESDAEDEPREITDNQLQELIKRKRLEFEHTSREIEAEVRREELRETGADPDSVVDNTPDRKSRSSATPPPLESNTPKKIPERRLSDRKNNHHKSSDRVDGPRKLDIILEEKIKREHTPSPPRENHKKKEPSVSTSDSEDDSSSSRSESSYSQTEVKVEKRAKKRKRKSSTDSDRRKSKKQKKDKSRKSERSRHDYDRKSKRKDDRERSHKSSRSRDVRERSHKDKYREDSEDRRRGKRSKRSRSPSHERRRSRARDASEDRPRRRERSHERSRSDRYERSRDYDRRRSRTRSRSHRR